jgi:hypothetical protein
MAQGWNIDAAADTITFLESVANTATVVVNEYATAAINATSVWAIGAWNGAYGYPAVAEFYEDRLVFFGTVDQPQTGFFSRINDYSFFGKSTPLQDDDSFSVTLNGRQLNQVVGLIPKRDLLAFTTGGVWKIGGDGAPLAPTTVSAKLQPSSGASANLAPLDAGESAIYLSFMGSEVRDLAFTFEADGYAGSDLTAFAGHLLRGRSLQSWCWCPEPWSAVFSVRDDGVMLSMTYKREHQVVAWARRETQGRILAVESIPEDGGFGTYLVVERIVGGVAVQYYERLADQAHNDFREGVGLDCALTYDGRNTTATTLTLAGGATPGAEVTVTASASIFSPSSVGDEIVLQYNETPVRIRISARDSGTVVRGTASRPLTAGDLAPGTYWALAVDTLSGLGHLEGLEVQVAGDGFDLGLYAVASGTIALRQPAVLAHVGLPFSADFESLDMVVVGGESVATRRKVVKKVAILVKGAGLIRASAYGFDRMETFAPRDTRQSMSSPPELRTQWIELNVGSDWAQDPRIYLQAPGPYGVQVLAIEPRVEIGS